MKELHPPIAQELLIELYGCTNFNLDYKKILSEAAKNAKQKPIKYVEYKYKGFPGLSAVLIISESHISIHTWPEYGYVSIDVYTCGSRSKPYNTIDVFKKYFKPKYLLINEIQRGVNQ